MPRLGCSWQRIISALRSAYSNFNDTPLLLSVAGWDASNPEHVRLMRLHLHGNGAAHTPTIEEDLAMIRAAGFEIKVS